MVTTRRSGEAESAPAADQAKEFGAALREMRIAQGRELADVADHLRIRKVYLQAIEEGRFDDLPGPTYATGFVRAYADYLGLEVEEVVRRFKQSTQGISTQAQLVPPSPVAEGRLPTGSVLLVAAILAAAAYGGWYYISSEGRDPGEVVAALPERIADLVGFKRGSPPGSLSPASVTAPESAPTQLAPSEAPAEMPSRPDPQSAQRAESPAPAPSDPAPEETARIELAHSPGDAAQPSQAAPEPEFPSITGQTAPGSPSASDMPQAEAQTAAPSPTESGAEMPALPTAESGPAPPAVPEPPPQTAAASPALEESNARVVLRANASAWVEVRDSQGRRVFSRLMRPGETYAVPSGPGVTLATGNAGGLDIVVDGRTLPPLGPAGGVRRDVALDAEALLSRMRSPSP